MASLLILAPQIASASTILKLDSFIDKVQNSISQSVEKTAEKTTQVVSQQSASVASAVNGGLERVYGFAIDKAANVLLPLFVKNEQVKTPSQANQNFSTSTQKLQAPTQNKSVTSPIIVSNVVSNISRTPVNTNDSLLQNILRRLSALESKSAATSTINQYITNTYVGGASYSVPADPTSQTNAIVNAAVNTAVVSLQQQINSISPSSSGAATNTFAFILATSTTATSSFSGNVGVGGNITTGGSVSATTFYGDGSNLTGIVAGSAFSTSTTRSVFSATGGLSYNNSTGVFSSALGYTIPLTASTTEWANSVASLASLTASVSSLNSSISTLNASTTALTSIANTLTASTSNLSLFWSTPSSRISAGTGLSWSGNTLVNTGVTSVTGDWTGTFDGQDGSYYLSRANQTGTQLASTISDFNSSARTSLSVSGNILTYNNSTGVFGFSTSSLSTSDIAEGSNQYFTNTRADTRADLRIGAATTTIQNMIPSSYIRPMISSSATGLSYDNSTGVFSLASGYTIPLTASTTEWANRTASQWTTTGSDIYYTTGNVGIGTTTPASRLGVLSTTEQLRLLYDSTNFTKFTVGSGSGLTMTPGVNGVNAFNFTNVAGTSVLNIDTTNSRVGVANGTPAGMLDIINTSAVPSVKIYNAYASDVFSVNKAGAGNILSATLTSAQNNGFIVTLTDTSTYLYNTSTYGFKADISNNTDNISNAGGYFRGANLRTSAGSNSNLAIGVDAYAQSGITGGTYGYAGRFTAQSANIVPILAKGAASQTADLFQVQNSSGTGLFNISSSGNVGIGTSSPAYALAVAGDINLTGALRLNGSAGTSGMVLQSTGSGTQWVATSSLGITGGGSSQWTTNGSNIYYNTGNIGIGTTTPGSLLAVAGNGSFTGTLSTGLLQITGPGTSTIASNISLSGSIIPTADITYDLGSPDKQWKDVYIGPGSLYINGQKVLQEESQSIVVTADTNQNLVFRTAGTGDLELNPSGTGLIQLKGNVQLSAGYDISTSNNSPISFSDGIKPGNISISANKILTTNINGSLELSATGTGAIYTTVGNFGIGTSSPAYALAVAGDINLTGALRLNGSAGTSGMVLQSTGSGTQWVATSSLGITGGGSSQWTTTGSDIYYTTGNVGVGISSPADRLAVSGNIYATTGTIIGGATATTTGTRTVITPGSITGFSGTESTARFRFGNAGITNGVGGLVFDSTVAGLNGNGGGIGQSVARTVSLYTGDGTSLIERLRVDGSGNVGIGTTTPTQRLSVAGNFYLTGALFDSLNASGTSGMVLQSTGTGTQWVATSSLGITGGGSSLTGTTGQIAYFSGTNSVVGTSTMFISTAGNVGIGTTNPSQKLVVKGSAVISNLADDSGNNYLYFNNHGGSGGDATYIKTAIITSPTGGGFGRASLSFAVNGLADSSNVALSDAKLTITSSGVSAPVLSADTVSVADGLVDIRTKTNDSTNTYLWMTNHQSYYKTGIITTPTGSFGRGNMYFALSSSGDAVSATISDSKLTILNSGNIGIGTTTPTQRLSVAGNFYLTGALFDSLNASGTSGMVLQSTGTGTQWVATSSLGIVSGGSTGTVNSGLAGQVAFYGADGTTLSGTSSLFFSGGNIGIGTTTPGAALQITRSNSANEVEYLRFTSSNTSAAGDELSTYWNSGNSIRLAKMSVLNEGSGNAGFRYALRNADGSVHTRLILNGSGFLGIGSTTPLAPLHVTRLNTIAGVESELMRYSLPGNSFAGDELSTYWYSQGSTHKLAKMSVINEGSGKAGFRFGTTNDGAATTPNRVAITGDGRLGVGIVTPSATLEVVGTASTTVLNIPNTTAITNGAITMAGSRFIHGYTSNSIFAGINAGNFTTTGSYNTGIGASALSTITSGHSNVGVGPSALAGVTTGTRNIGIGYLAMGSGTGGGNDNLAIGYGSLGASSVTGNYNTVIGNGSAGRVVGSASGNTILGYSAGFALTGGNNVLIGYQAGDNLVGGTNNIIIGYNVDATSTTMTQGLNIGNLLFGTALDGSGTTLSSGNIGIGTTTPWAKLTVAGEIAATHFTAASTTATSTFPGGLSVGGGALVHDWSSGLTTISNAALGAMTFDADSGMVSWIDMPVTAASASGTVQSYSAQLDGTPALTVYGLSDGAGAVNNIRLGVGTSTPTQALSVVGTINATNLLGGSTNLTVDANGNIIRDPSDENLKENIVTLEDSLSKIAQLRGVRYEWKDKERFGTSTEIGVIAQEVEMVVPEVVSSGGLYKSVNIKNLVALLIEGVKELKTKVDGVTAWFGTSGDRFNVKGMVCVDDVCVSKEQFKQMLINSGSVMTAPQQVPAPAPTSESNTSSTTESTSGSTSGGESTAGDNTSGGGASSNPDPENTPPVTPPETPPASEPAPAPVPEPAPAPAPAE